MAGSGNPVSDRIHDRLLEVGRATARGTLIPTPQGWYPAFFAEMGTGEVHGKVYDALPNWTSEDLALLDAYEAYYPSRPDASEYLRRKIEIVRDESRADERESADAYIYQAPLPPDAVPVLLGDFRRFLSDAKATPYCVSPSEIDGVLARFKPD